jgi:ADP-heptose:LPS heptosyltransferase
VDTEKSIYADLLGAAVTADAETFLQLQLEPRDLPVPAGSDYVVINPGFSGAQKPGYRSHRAWPLAHWHKLIELLCGSAGLSVLINGTADEQQEFTTLLSTDGVHSLFGSSIPTLAGALENARGLFTVDTGTMHLAMALKTPVIALFGPTNPLLTGPYSHKTPGKVLVSGADCHPCVGTPEQKKCSFNRCMTELEPRQVFQAYQELLKIQQSDK